MVTVAPRVVRTPEFGDVPATSPRGASEEMEPPTSGVKPASRRVERAPEMLIPKVDGIVTRSPFRVRSLAEPNCFLGLPLWASDMKSAQIGAATVAPYEYPGYLRTPVWTFFSGLGSG